MHGGIDDDVFADFLGNCFGGEGAPDGMELVEDLVFDEGPRNGKNGFSAVCELNELSTKEILIGLMNFAWIHKLFFGLLKFDLCQ